MSDTKSGEHGSVKKDPPKDASKATRDCYSDCGAEYDACMAKAGSDFEKAACNTAYRNCIVNCPV
jgi:hypothetical protein